MLSDIILLYVCPSLGGIMSTMMFAAPVNDMREALVAGNLGDLNPFPFGMMTGNTFGWILYGYLMWDPFLIASNLPGFFVSLWLNIAVAKLQYFDIREHQKQTITERHQVMQRWDAHHVAEEDSPHDEAISPMTGNSFASSIGRLLKRRGQRQQSSLETQPEGDALLHDNNNSMYQEGNLEITPQETLLLRVLLFWAGILIYTTWLYPKASNPASSVGVIVNINLVAFYAAPLKTIKKVVSTKNSSSIHVPTMIMNYVNTSFWIGYGCARRDLVIVVPNATGLLLGLAQGALCALYPRQQQDGARLSLHELEADLGNSAPNPENSVPSSASVSADEAAGGD